ncbi:hypothetical protein MKW98_028653, partial [Papaver atlanticum]
DVLIRESKQPRINPRVSAAESQKQYVRSGLSKLFFWITGIDERFRGMILLIKEWEKTRQINDPKNAIF